MPEIEAVLKWDEGKVLKGGKRRYSDNDGHSVYLMGDEVKDLEAPDKVTLIIRPA
jgi:hypothetical protein